MLGAIFPLAVLVLMEVGERPVPADLWSGVAMQGVLALGLTMTEHRFFEAGADLARAAIVQFAPTHYTGSGPSDTR